MHETLESKLDHTVVSTGVGTRTDLSKMVDALHDQVKRVSASEMKRAFDGRPLDGLTLAPTAITNDAMMRVLRQRSEVQSEGQFFALAARFVRQLVIDYQRERMAMKRGNGVRARASDESLEVESPEATHEQPTDLVRAALARLAEEYPRKAEVVTLHIVCGHPMPRVAKMVGVSLATAERDWIFAKAWLGEAVKQARAGEE